MQTLRSTPGAASESPPSGTERRLAAIAVLDVVGYSRLMDLDEEGTHARWMRMCADLISPKVRSHRGSIIKSTGDGFLIEFRSAVEAVSWALALQSAVSSADASATALPVRIAIHLADIIPERHDIFGSHVNIASRLQEFGEPGFVVVSAAVHEQVRRVLEYSVTDLGLLALKNIQRPVHAFSISPSNERPPLSAVSPRLSRQPSIAVLPPRAIGGHAVDPHLTEGIVHEIVASLASLKELFVISSGSTVGLTGETGDNARIGRRLGVRYLITGAIARAVGKLRLYAELADVETSEVIWNSRYDISDDELFAVQDAIASKVAYSLIPHLRQSEMQRALRKPPENRDAYDLVLQALHRLHRFGEGDFENAHRLLNEAIARDPRYSIAYALLARWHVMRVGQGYSINVNSDAQEAHRLSSLALEHDPSNPLALGIYGHVMSFMFKEYDRALEAFDRAIASSPNSAIAWSFSSPTFSYLGEGPAAVQRAEHGLLLSPLDPQIYWTQSALTLAHYVNGSYEESVRWGRHTLALNPHYTTTYRPLIASLVALDRHDEAREVGRLLAALEPNFHVDPFIARYPIRDATARTRYAERLVAAGLPH